MKKIIIIFLLLNIAISVSDKANTIEINFNDSNLFDTSLIVDLFNFLDPSDNLPSFEVFQAGMRGYFKLLGNEKLKNKRYITIIDFSQASTEKRLWVIDLYIGRICYNTLVAHGKNTGEDRAYKFSNRPKSNMSSLGFYLTENIYIGKHGYSMRLDGLEKGINDNAKKRAIVVHPADYVTEEFVAKHGRLGRSFGCPALPPERSTDIINTIKGNSLFYIYYPDKGYFSQSLILNK